MKPGPAYNAQLPYHCPAVRHLAWICQAPLLTRSPAGFNPREVLPENYRETLLAWDQQPEKAPALLTEAPPRRLGHYFEKLYQCLLEHLLGWQILLKNQPVRSRGLTLGEFDFIVRNPLNQSIEHHEVAVKFYLGYPDPHTDRHFWYGPNSRDRLDLKTHRLLTHQSRLAEKPEAQDLLRSLGIPPPSRARIFMPGYLFYPAHQQMPAPVSAPAYHLRGQWIHITDLEKFRGQAPRPGAALPSWVPLFKPHWLGPWHQSHKPDKKETEQALDRVQGGLPQLFALMQPSDQVNQWHEISRLFVMPEFWPGP